MNHRSAPTAEPAAIHLVRIATAHDQPLFADFDTARCVARIGAGREVWRDSRLLAWVLMPDHWRGLVQVGALDSLATAVGRLKSATSRAVRRLHPELRLWAATFEDRRLGAQEDPARAARSLVAGPLRAGLVQQLGDYAFWDAVWMDPDAAAGSAARAHPAARVREAAA